MDCVFLIRHGESETNAGLATMDPVQVGLTPDGEKQAKFVAQYLEVYHPQLIVTSPYQRTKQTAKPTLDVLRQSVLQDEWPVQEFTYLSPKRLGCSTIEDRKPEVKRYWQHAIPDRPDGPGAESFESFINRVLDFFELLKSEEEKYETIAIFSHEQFINAVLWIIDFNANWIRDRNPVISSRTMRQFRTYLNSYPIPNGAIASLTFSYNENRWRYELITEHLKRAMPEAPSPPLEDPVLTVTH